MRALKNGLTPEAKIKDETAWYPTNPINPTPATRMSAFPILSNLHAFSLASVILFIPIHKDEQRVKNPGNLCNLDSYLILYADGYRYP